MIEFLATPFFAMSTRLKRESTYIDLFYEFFRSMPQIQNLWFRGPGPSSGNSLSTRTVVMRAYRLGYYERRPLGGVTPAGPFGLWSGNTRDHTTAKKGKIDVRENEATLSFDLPRWWLVSPWDVRELQRQLGTIHERRMQIIFDGNRPSYLRRAS